MSGPQSPARSDEDQPITSNEKTERKPGNATPGGQPVEDVEDRPNVGMVKPEDYPPDQRAKG
ncbi:MAG: hypothetical protein E7773_04645 [Sphingomonas sp.]|uniref:hypothetical protein n=1 Tax=Sphingomonas sp. TaxID=28214 RepID=UPI0012251251|nr:hypothetical protein [Sphingomonas sp.]THD37320.1 MAG: hypothetical protein E7773_04645 [Sphingomonas sp.]